MARYRIAFAEETIDHLDYIEAKYHSLIEKTLEEQLGWSPDVETKNRKILEQPAPFRAKWQLRFGVRNEFRAFYRIDEKEHVVMILALDTKLVTACLLAERRSKNESCVHCRCKNPP